MNLFGRYCWHVILGPITAGRRGPEEALRHSAWGATKRPLKMVDHSGLTGCRLRYFNGRGRMDGNLAGPDLRASIVLVPNSSILPEFTCVRVILSCHIRSLL